jgi:hypothetical protein
MDNPFVTVTAYKGFLIIEALIKEEHSDWVPAGSGRIGCILIDTKTHLGISDEAFELLKEIPQSLDDIGEVDWFDSDDGKRVFGWLGPTKRLIDPKDAEGSRNYKVSRDFLSIPNEPDPDAVKAIDGICGLGGGHKPGK